MVITNKAKSILQNLLIETGFDTIKVFFKVSSCCGKQFMIDLISKTDSDRIINVNGLNVAISKTDEEETTDVILDEKNGKLVLVTQGGCCFGSGCC